MGSIEEITPPDQPTRDRVKESIDKYITMRVYGWPMSARRWMVVLGNETLSTYKEFDNEDEARAYAKVLKSVITNIVKEVTHSELV